MHIVNIPAQFMHPVIKAQHLARLVLTMESILRLSLLPVLCGLGGERNVKGLPSGTIGRYLPGKAFVL